MQPILYFHINGAARLEVTLGILGLYFNQTSYLTLGASNPTIAHCSSLIRAHKASILDDSMIAIYYRPRVVSTTHPATGQV